MATTAQGYSVRPPQQTLSLLRAPGGVGGKSIAGRLWICAYWRPSFEICDHEIEIHSAPETFEKAGLLATVRTNAMEVLDEMRKDDQKNFEHLMYNDAPDVLVSMTTGEDMLLKFPTIFNSMDVASIIKLDLAAAVEFDGAAARRSFSRCSQAWKLSNFPSGRGRERQNSWNFSNAGAQVHGQWPGSQDKW